MILSIIALSLRRHTNKYTQSTNSCKRFTPELHRVLLPLVARRHLPPVFLLTLLQNHNRPHCGKSRRHLRSPRRCQIFAYRNLYCSTIQKPLPRRGCGKGGSQAFCMNRGCSTYNKSMQKIVATR